MYCCTLPGDNIRPTKSLSQNTLHSSKSSNSTQSYRNKRKEILYKCLKPHKCYKLPLPKSVPHIPKSFFTEHLFINCVFNDELVTGESEAKNCNISNPLGNQNKETSCSSNKFNSIFRKPKIPAPDFKLRESRKALHNSITKSSIVLSVRQSSKRRLDFINNLLNKKSHETVSRKKSKIKTLENQKSTYSLNHLPLKCKDLNNTIITDTVLTQTTHCRKSKTDSSITYRSAVILDIPKRECTSCDIINQNINKKLEDKNKFLFLDNDLKHCHKKSELKHNKSYKESSKTLDNKKDSFIICNQPNKKNQKSKSEDLSKNLSNKEINKTLLQGNKNHGNSTTRLTKFGFAFVHSTKILNEQLCNFYTCIIKKIDAYLQLNTYKSFENSNCIPNNYLNNSVLHKIKNCNFHVAFSQSGGFSDKNIQPQIQNSVHMENNKSDKKKFSDPKSSCPCQPTKSNLLQKRHKNISESLFYGPTLDEVVQHLFGFIRYICKQLGLIHEEPKPPTTYCCGDTRCNKETCDMPCDVGRNNTDVVKWLHDEYINLAKDIAETNNEQLHNCPCVQENNCPVVLQSRRFVLDRLAELLEKKQELEITYRRNERKALSNNPNTEEPQKRCHMVCK